MLISNKKAILKILNLNCEKPEYPSYDHIILDNRKYNVIDLSKMKAIYSNNKNQYHEYEVIVSGIIHYRKGFLPNPMVISPVFEIVEISII